MSYVRAKTVKGHTYYYQVTTSRSDGKVVQKVEKYFGKNPPQKSGRIESTTPSVVTPAKS